MGGGVRGWEWAVLGPDHNLLAVSQESGAGGQVHRGEKNSALTPTALQTSQWGSLEEEKPALGWSRPGHLPASRDSAQPDGGPRPELTLRRGLLALG